MTDQPKTIEGFTLSCPCKGRVIEGTAVRIHGQAQAPEVGAVIVCACGCLHVVREIDDAGALIIVGDMTADEMIEAHRALGHDAVKVACPRCEYAAVTPWDGGALSFADGYIFTCTNCGTPFVSDGERDGDELRTRVLTVDEAAAVVRSLDAQLDASPFRPFGGP